MAAWNESGVVTHETLCAVLKEFKEKRYTRESERQLAEWMENLPPEVIKEMCDIDKAVTLQILVDCFGVSIAFQKYINAVPEICKQALADAGYVIFVKAEFENEMVAKQQKIEQMEVDKAKLMDISMGRSERVETLENENAALKIALFDTYTEAGKIKLPRWEEGRY